MSDGEAFRRAIVENPDEDLHRLVFADWLEENGQPERAAFIRVQVEAVRTEPHGPLARAATARADGLLRRNRVKWSEFVRHAALDYGFERGFVYAVTLQPEQFAHHSETMFAREPIQSLRLTRYTDPELRVPFEPVFELPQLRQIRHLAFAPRIELIHDEYAALLKCPHLSGVTELTFNDNPVHPPWVREWFAGDAFPALTALNVADIPNLGPALLASCLAADHRVIRKLDASRVMFTSEQLRRMLNARCLQQLVELRLAHRASSGGMGPMFHLNLGWVLPWERLTVLDLAGQQIGDEGVQAIVRTAEAKNLRWLRLADNHLTNESVKLLATSKRLNLHHLDVKGNDFLPAHVEVLRARFPDAEVVG